MVVNAVRLKCAAFFAKFASLEMLCHFLCANNAKKSTTDEAFSVVPAIFIEFLLIFLPDQPISDTLTTLPSRREVSAAKAIIWLSTEMPISPMELFSLPTRRS